MTRRLRIAGIALLSGLLLFAAWAGYKVAAQTREQRSMASLMPQGALLFLEASDFSALLREWSTSPEKQAWLKSDNYETFSRSRLFQRLQQAQSEFATAAGLPPDMAFLEEVAGQQSALGWYDIGNLELLYITKLPSSRVMTTRLWQRRSQFEPRLAAGKQFFVRTDSKSGRVAAFALDGDYFVVGTREDLVAGALSLLANQHLATVEAEGWFADAIKAAKAPGELRLVLHLSELAKTPQFRTYWIQQNITAMRQYKSSVTDLFRSGSEYREERVLVPINPVEDSPSSQEDARYVAELLRLASPDVGFYRATATPSVETALAVLEQKVLMPQLGPAPPEKTVPVVSLGEGTVGNDANLETRIDVPPPVNVTETKADKMLQAVLTKANVRALIVLHGSDPAGEGVFVRLRSTVVLRGSADWDESAVHAAVQHVIAPALTTSQLGATWRKAQGYSEFDGLAPVLVAVRGKYLIVGNDAGMVAGVLTRINQPISTEPAVYAAAFRHERERQNFYRLASVVDTPSRTNAESYDHAPQFFSQNVASLSRVFAGVKSQSVVVRRNGGLETQTVRYEWER
jgi:hypothetical protein